MDGRLFGFLYLSISLVGFSQAQTNAVCELMINPSLPADEQQPISGSVTFSQDTAGGTVTLVLDIQGFNTTDSELLHGFHVHETSDFSDGCQSTGGHFNPAGVKHGAPTATVRHVGDLGNIEEDGVGRVQRTLTDDVIDFSGNNNILDRAIVIHALEDDLGLGGDSGSEATGNAGARLACCVIKSTNKATTSATLNIVIIFISIVLSSLMSHVK